MSSLSATELSRLHRQRRLECSSPIHRVTPVNLKRRSRRNSGSSAISAPLNKDEVSGTVISKEMITSTAFSFDEEVMAANSNNNNNNGSFTKDDNGVVKSSPAAMSTPSNHGRSFSFSSFSVPATTTNTDTSMETLKSPPPHTPTNAVTPPDSPGHRSTASAAYRTMSPRRRPSPTPSLGTHLDKKNNRTPNRPGKGGVSRSDSTRSMPLTSPSKKKKTPKKNSSGVVSHSRDSDMPMDELMAASSRHKRYSKRPPTRNNRSFDTPLLTDGSLMNTSADDSLASASLPSPNTSSTALVVSGTPTLARATANVLNRMAQALQVQTRPVRMSPDEEHLWEVVQKITKENALTTASNGDEATWKERYQQREDEWSEQAKEHDRALRAIQRVLADVTTEREDSVNRLKEELEQRDNTFLKLTTKLKEMQNEVNAAKANESEQVAELRDKLESMQKDNDQMKKDIEARDEKLTSQETALQQRATETDESTEAVKDLKEVTEKQAQHIAQLEKEVQEFRSKDKEVKDVANSQDELAKQLEEKTSSLENAKMIIASLENANGSLAKELRAQLKQKEEELATLTSTSADRKRTLDSLATELRELQRQQQKPRMSPKQMANQRALCQMLEKNVKSLRQAAVQHEARNDKSSVDRISQIVSATFSALKQNLESWDVYLRNNDVQEGQSPAATSSNPNLEAALAKKTDELQATQEELDQVKSQFSQENATLQQEVETLKQQLVANSAVLARKGRELAVLKDSLNLEDTGTGYISDDGTDAEETETEPAATGGQFPFPSSSSENPDFSGSLLVHGGPGVGQVNPNAAEMSDATAAEIQMLKNEIIKQQKEREANAAELQAEKESLANAKMIISSLEKANKSMLEDLRARLQDSNTAIASLLEKSIEHEKTIAMLRKELETCRQEREKDGKKATAQMTKLRDENLVFSMRLAAKDREVEELQETLSQYEGQEVSIASSKVRMPSVEEKKDDPESDEDS